MNAAEVMTSSPVWVAPDTTVREAGAVLALRACHRDPRWTVSVDRGDVKVTGSFADDAERRVIEALVRAVPGVRTSAVVS
ncbi:BON domain-containing protein [Lentzea sp.]|uniref:BON domain-containing protein n=1 Tax=Lentzea sp. TaxID=56099 RepID=UPI002ED17043